MGKIVKKVAHVAVAAGVGFVTGGPWGAAIAASASVFGEIQKSSMGDTGKQSPNAQTLRSSKAPVRFILGRASTGGVLAWAQEDHTSSAKHEWVHLVYVLSEGEIEGVDEIYLNEKLITEYDSKNWSYDVRINPTEHDSFLAERCPDWKDTQIGRGISYLRLSLRYDPEVFSGIPDVRCVVRGLKLYDPRSNKEEFSENPALMALWYLRNRCQVPDDEIIMDAFKSAANLCDESVTNADGSTGKRYTASAVIGANESRLDVLNKLEDAMVGNLIMSGGRWAIQAGAYYGPAAFTITEDMVIGTVSGSTEVDNASAINVVTGTFIDPKSSWAQTDFPAASMQEWIKEDGGEKSTSLSLDYVSDAYQAQRIAHIKLKQNRGAQSVSLTLNLSGYACRPGMVVKLDLPSLNMTKGEFLVTDWSYDPHNGISVTLQTTDADIWDDAVGEAYNPLGYISLPAGGIGSPTNLHWDVLTYGDSVQGVLSWSPVDTAQSYDVHVREQGKGGADVYSVSVPATSTRVQLHGLPAGKYTASVAARGNRLKSGEASINIEINVPPVPATVTVSAGNYEISLTPMLKDGDTLGGGTWEFYYDQTGKLANSEVEGKATYLGRGLSYTHVGLQADTKYVYWVRGVNAYGVGDWYKLTAHTENNADDIMAVISGHITESDLEKELQKEVEKISGDGDDSVNQRVEAAKKQLKSDLDKVDKDLTAADNKINGRVDGLNDDVKKAQSAADAANSNITTARVELGQEIDEVRLSAADAQEAADDARNQLNDDVADLTGQIKQNRNGLTSLTETVNKKDSATNKRIDGLDSTVGDNAADIATEAKTRADADGALGKRVDAVQAAAKDAKAAISREEQARVKGDESTAESISNLTAASSGTNAGDSLVLNANGSNNAAFWNPIGKSKLAGPASGGGISVHSGSEDGDNGFYSDRFPLSGVNTIRVKTRPHRNSNNKGGAASEIKEFIKFYDQDGNLVGATDQDRAAGSNWTAEVPNAAKSAEFWVQSPQSTYSWQLWQIRVEADSLADNDNAAQITSVEKAYKDADKALAKRIDTVEATAKGNKASITDEQQARADGDKAKADALSQLKATVGDNTSSINDEKTARADADKALGKRVDSVEATSKDNKAAINSEQKTRASKDDALGKRIDTVEATTKENAANITGEQEARADGDKALGKRVDSVEATAKGNKSAITDEQKARADGDKANADAISQVKADTGKNSTAITDERKARSDADSALGKRVDSVQATAKDNQAAISAEQKARSDADSSLADQISQVSAQAKASGNLIPDPNFLDFGKNGFNNGDNDDVSLNQDENDGGNVVCTTGRIDSANLDYVEGRTYVASMKIRGKPGQVSFRVVTRIDGKNRYWWPELRPGNVEGDWTTYSGQCTLPSNVTQFSVSIRPTSSNDRYCMKQPYVGLQTAGDAYNSSQVAEEQQARADGDSANADRISKVQSSVDKANSAITDEQKTRASKDDALGKRIDAVESSVGDNKAAIKSEEEARTSKDNALGKRIDSLQAATKDNQAAINSEQEARANDREALTQRISDMAVSFGHDNLLPDPYDDTGDFWTYEGQSGKIGKSDDHNTINGSKALSGLFMVGDKGALRSYVYIHNNSGQGSLNYTSRIEFFDRSKKPLSDSTVVSSRTANLSPAGGTSLTTGPDSCPNNAYYARFVIERADSNGKNGSGGWQIKQPRVESQSLEDADISASITSVEKAYKDGDKAITEQVNKAQSAADKAASSIDEEKKTRASEDKAITEQVSQLSSKLDSNYSTIRNDYMTKSDAKSEIAKAQTTAQSYADGKTASVQQTLQSNIDKTNNRVDSIYTVKLDNNGHIAGFGLSNDGKVSQGIFNVDSFAIAPPGSKSKFLPFVVQAGGVYMNTAMIQEASIGSVQIGDVIQSANFTYPDAPSSENLVSDPAFTNGEWYGAYHVVQQEHEIGNYLRVSDANGQASIESARFDVHEGWHYKYSAVLKNFSGGGPKILMNIHWLDANGNDKGWANEIDIYPQKAGSWTSVKGDAWAPSGAKKGILYFQIRANGQWFGLKSPVVQSTSGSDNGYAGWQLNKNGDFYAYNGYFQGEVTATKFSAKSDLSNGRSEFTEKGLYIYRGSVLVVEIGELR
ncbi:phage tail tip fiber protein [Carnimonas bestiolae]|uniref:phage tail tip fiber protein n=1 Tax=Carnimonas bestiolae TaxID=3402172 RepID=UPI003EDC9C5F